MLGYDEPLNGKQMPFESMWNDEFDFIYWIAFNVLIQWPKCELESKYQ